MSFKTRNRPRVEGLTLDLRFESQEGRLEDAKLDPTPRERLAPSPATTPVHTKFASSHTPFAKPTLVAAIPRARKLDDGGSRPSSSSMSPATPQQHRFPLSATSPSSPINGIPFPPFPSTPTLALAPVTPAQSPLSLDLEDGPLFRAVADSLERRAKNLRTCLKALIKAGQDSLAALQANATAQALVDEALEALSLSSSTSQSEVLGGLYDRALKEKREERKHQGEKEMQRLEEMLERVRGGCERIKTLETRKKAFEAESKKHYDELAKYLSRTENEPSKTASLDSKQIARSAAFQQHRIEYYAFVESLVESEERAAEVWLKAWAGVEDDPVRITITEEARWESRDKQRLTVARSLADGLPSFENGEHLEGGGGETDGAFSDDGGSASGGSALSRGETGGAGGKGAGQPTRRRRRSSIPAFTVDKEGARDRIKGFLKTAQHQISSAMPSSHSSPTLSADAIPRPVLSNKATTTLTVPAVSTSRSQLASQARRKEGLLYATSKPASHTTTGDGGGSWSAHWCVLSEGQLVEFSNWKSLNVKNTPINLAFASARVSHNTDRRFCFEILTPSSRRIYQATGESEMTDWVSAISKSIESLLNGTSSVRHFDASRLTGSSTPYSLNDFGSSISLPRNHTTGDNPTPATPTSPSGGLSQISSRLPSWIGPPLSRRASLGGKIHSKNHISPRQASPPPSRRRHQSVLSEGASLSTPSISLGSSSSDDDASDTGSLCDHDRQIQSLVSGWAGPVVGPNEALEAKKRNARRIRELAEAEGNSVCADCGASDPGWASWSLGITLCIRCSGIHRSLGTHVSKVRSIELDDWNDEQLGTMEAWGNVKANAHWEARKSGAVLVDDATIAAFIKRKYVEKAWIALPPPERTSRTMTMPAIPEVASLRAARASGLPA